MHYSYMNRYKKDLTTKLWRKKNPDKVKAMQKRYNIKHKDQIKKYMKDWNKKNRKNINKNMRQYIQKIKNKFFIMLGGKCVCKNSKWHKGECNITILDVLEPDHKFGDGKKDSKRFSNNNTLERLYYLKHPKEAKKKLQLFCCNCHEIKTYKNKDHLRKNTNAKD